MIAWILVGLGCAFLIIGTIGIVRFRDVYSRLQASGVSDNVGSAILLVGLMVLDGLTARDAALLFLIALLLITNPIATHSIARSAFASHHEEGGGG